MNVLQNKCTYNQETEKCDSMLLYLSRDILFEI